MNMDYREELGNSVGRDDVIIWILPYKKMFEVRKKRKFYISSINYLEIDEQKLHFIYPVELTILSKIIFILVEEKGLEDKKK